MIPLRCILFNFCFLISFASYADDTGITKVRLKQLNDSTYILEADFPQILLTSISTPVLPERFRFVDFRIENNSGWIRLYATMASSGAPLSSEDEILLPWNRNGADFTVQWLDGTVYKKLFYRSLKGIHIPLNELMPQVRTTQEVFLEHFILGLKHQRFLLIHLLFILALVLLSNSSKSLLGNLLWYSGGQATSLVLSEILVLKVDLLYSDMMIVLLVFLIAYVAIYHRSFRFFGLTLFAVGAMHSMSYAHELVSIQLESIQRIQALFAFNLAIDLVQFTLAFLLLIPFKVIWPRISKNDHLVIGMGSVSVFLFLLIYQQYFGQKGISENQAPASSQVTNENLPSAPGNTARSGSGMMTTPVMSFLSIEPFEVRHEILIRADIGLGIIEAEQTFPISIPVESQETVKESLQHEILESYSLEIDGQLFEPKNKMTDFVILSRGGVAIKEGQNEESVDEAILGITFTYDLESPIDSIKLHWSNFPESIQKVEASAVDRFGATTLQLSRETPDLQWTSKIKAANFTDIRPVLVDRKRYPIASFIFWCTGLILFFYRGSLIRNNAKKNLMLILLLLGYALFPFVRTQAELSWLGHDRLSKDKTLLIMNELLTNTYHAFDYKNEDQVYDRLALNVQGDKLTEIYLQNRRAMELEERGGARATVEEVKVIEIFRIGQRVDSDACEADVLWTVMGSVNHFGHTHYRQNQYRALITFFRDADTWKISDMEFYDVERLF